MDNLLTDGAALLAMGGLGAYLRNVPNSIKGWGMQLTTTCLNIRDSDPEYDNWDKWLSDQKLLLPVTAYDITYKKLRPQFSFNVFRYNDKFVFCSQETNRDKGNDRYIQERAIYLRFVRFSKEEIDNLFLEVTTPRKGDLRIVIVSVRGKINPVMSDIYRQPRSLNTIFMPGNLKNEIKNDLEAFKTDYQWYFNHSIIWKRGICLYGEPGGGKSSLVVALASALKLKRIYCPNLEQMDNESFSAMYSNMYGSSILLLEDVDCLKQSNREAETKGVTFDCLLNHLDGPLSRDGVIIFMTTNHLDRLDPALIRPGRIDRTFHIPTATAEQKRDLFLSFYPEEEKSATTFAERVGSLAMCTLQELFIANRTKTATEVLRDLDQLILPRE